MISSNDYIKLLKFFYDNRFLITGKEGQTVNYSQLVFDDDTQLIDKKTIQIAINAKLESINYFKSALDIQVLNNKDFNKLRAFIIDWYSANKTFIELKKQSTDPALLTDIMIDKAFKSFGYNYSSFIYDKATRVQFLLSLTELYKNKGTAQTLETVLNFHGISNIAIYEWWLIKRTVDGEQDLYFEGRKLSLNDIVLDLPERRYIKYDDFLNIVSDRHWMYTKEQILQIQSDTNNTLGLPSITPYFSVAGGIDLTVSTFNFSVLERLLSDQYDNYINGGDVPLDLYSNIYRQNISLLTLYLAIFYCYYRYNDHIQYKELKEYIVENFSGLNPEDDPDNEDFDYSQPYSYEKLLKYCFTRVDSNGKPQLLDILSLKSQNINIPLVEYEPVNGGWLFPIGLDPFKLYPPAIEEYPNELNILPILDATGILDYDLSLILFDQQPVTSKTIENLLIYNCNDNSGFYTIPNYNVDVGDLTTLAENVELAYAEYDTIKNYPDNRTSFYEDFATHLVNFTKNESLHFIRNRFDPERMLTGLPRISTLDDLPTDPATNDYILFTNSGNPIVYKYNGTSWVAVENGLKTGYLGIDQDIIDYIELYIQGDPANYIDICNYLLEDLNTFVNTYLIQNNTNQLLLSDVTLKNMETVVDFFKPKRARLMAFELINSNQTPGMDTIVLEDELNEHMTIYLPFENRDHLRSGGIYVNYDGENYDSEDEDPQLLNPDGTTVISLEHDPDITDNLFSLTVYQIDSSGDVYPHLNDSTNSYIILTDVEAFNDPV